MQRAGGFLSLWQAMALMLLLMVLSLFSGVLLFLKAYIPAYLLFPLAYTLPFLLLFPLLFHLYKKQNGEALRFGFTLPRWSVVGLVLLIALGMANLSDLLLRWLSGIEALDSLNDAMVKTFANLYRNSRLGFLISTVLLAPVFEEVLFRGFFLRGFLKHYKPWDAIALSAFLFGLLHANPQQFIAAFLMGFFLGYAYWRTASLSVPILVHGLNNLSAFVGLWYDERRVGLEQAIRSVPISGTQLFWRLLSAVVALLLWYALERHYQNQKPSDEDRIRHP